MIVICKENSTPCLAPYSICKVDNPDLSGILSGEDADPIESEIGRGSLHSWRRGQDTALKPFEYTGKTTNDLIPGQKLIGRLAGLFQNLFLSRVACSLNTYSLFWLCIALFSGNQGQSGYA
ncbi:hypothetical protein BJY04DRAFT_22699 [Aspergillus karnatakaensis]|uniref:uncharacterized protein n=1 Tax=Aspergillus karnatakaensis TaxID=1810916 RepID=UPI003CCD8ED8